MRLALLFLVAVLPLRADELIVTNVSDAVNGDISSPAALQNVPGPDGVSLREAILAANSALGPDLILFSPSLSEQSVSLVSPLPEIATDGIGIVGPRGSAGEPLITIVNPPGSQVPILSVRASHFMLCRVGFIDLREGGAIAIRTARPNGQPSDITDFRLHGNYFRGLPGRDRTDVLNAVTVGVENGSTDSSISDVTIASNRFVDINGNGDSIGMGAGASINGLLKDVVVIDNVFLSSSFGVEIATAAVGGRVEEVDIARNSFFDNLQAVTLTGAIGLPSFPAARDNVTRAIRVTNNYITRSENPAFSLVGALDASNNVLEDVEISNNVIAENRTCAICMAGGQSITSTATRNQIRAIRIVNNTITGVGFAAGVSPVRDQGNRATENTITDILVVNTVFANQNGLDFGLEHQLVEATYCVTADSGRIGVKGNISGNPLFVDRFAGDYHLMAGSVAIDAGTSVDAPQRDRDGLARRGAVDIGAYEFNGVRSRRRAVGVGDPCSR